MDFWMNDQLPAIPQSFNPSFRIPSGMQKTPGREATGVLSYHSLPPVLAGSGSSGIISARPPCGVRHPGKQANSANRLLRSKAIEAINS
jgi:hypothetical protein